MKKKKVIKKILVITLSNLGDVVLTSPVIKNLKHNFPNSFISILCSPYVAELFYQDPWVEEVIKYDKHFSFNEKFKFALKLRKKKFDMILDLRHTLFPILIGPRYRNNLLSFSKDNMKKHKSFQHLKHLEELNLDLTVKDTMPYIYIPQKVVDQVNSILDSNNLRYSDYIAISPGGKSDFKIWPKSNFLELIDKLQSNFNYKIILLGNNNDKKISNWIKLNSNYEISDLSGSINILELAELIKRASILICNDSGSLHIASAVNTPTVAIFGPTNEFNYGPLAKDSEIIKDSIECRPCIYSNNCDTRLCLHNIKVNKVYRKVIKILEYGKSKAR